MKRILKKIAPRSLLSLYHLILAYLAAVWYGRPSENMLVVGVTGTSGKSSVAHFLRQILEYSGQKVGALSTVEFCIAGKCIPNNRKMTMLGRAQTQKFLRDIARAGCAIAIVETTSQGYLQNRHRFINYDIMVLTNLYPEHLEAHGGFENYKAAKLGIFKHAAGCRRKILDTKVFAGMADAGAPRRIGKAAVVNGAGEYADEFLDFPFDKKIKFTAADALPTAVPGKHTPDNVAAALTAARLLGIDEAILKQAAKGLKAVPGRIEFLPEAEAHGFSVIVDYAFEPVAMAALYRVADKLKPARVIHVLGSAGGGRDRSRRPVLGRFAAKRADVVIITNEDPYDDSPQEIINDVAKGAEEWITEHGLSGVKQLLKIAERKEAIGKAINLAQKDDLVLITGKGSEQGMVVRGKIVPGDDRHIAREALKNKQSAV